MTTRNLIEAEALASLLGDARLRVFDCRFDLAKPDWGAQVYQQAHIPGAVYAHLDRDLSGPKTGQTGRHPLPEQEALFAALSRMGIGPGVQVVAYDSNGGAYAVRLWWMLKLYGHSTAAVLDGGFPKWQAEGRPTRAGVETNPPAAFTGTLNAEMIADEQDAARAAEDPRGRLVDARAPERYRGETEPIDPVAGHIPGAINRFHGQNLDANGAMKPPEQLRAEFEQLLGDADPQKTVFYCGSGVTSIHHLLAMERAGLPGGKIYVGSWGHWIRDPKRPVAKD